MFAKEAVGTNTDRTVYGAASASASSFVVHHTQQISMAAVAGDADNISKQARKVRASTPLSVPVGTTNAHQLDQEPSKRQTASYARPQWGVPPRRPAPRTGPSTLHVRIM